MFYVVWLDRPYRDTSWGKHSPLLGCTPESVVLESQSAKYWAVALCVHAFGHQVEDLTVNLKKKKNME